MSNIGWNKSSISDPDCSGATAINGVDELLELLGMVLVVSTSFLLVLNFCGTRTGEVVSTTCEHDPDSILDFAFNFGVTWIDGGTFVSSEQNFGFSSSSNCMWGFFAFFSFVGDCAENTMHIFEWFIICVYIDTTE